MDDFYKEYILDHYRNPRNFGHLAAPTAVAEDLNPLCGDTIRVELHVDGDGRVDDVKFSGKGCAISQAATSMLTDIVKGKTAAEVAVLPKEELLGEIGIPLTPVRVKCAILGLGVVKVALNRSKGTALPEEWQGLDIA